MRSERARWAVTAAPLALAVTAAEWPARHAAATASAVAARQITVGDTVVRVTLHAPLTVSGVGAAQGAEWRDGHLYIVGDATTGVIREYAVAADTVVTPTGRALALTVGGRDSLAHPTGLTFHPRYGTFLGNTVAKRGSIYHVDWAALLRSGTLDGAILNAVEDDAAVQGSRPEFVRAGDDWFVATSDYGPSGNHVRLYDPAKLASVRRTSEPGVVVGQFRCGPWVQSLHWLDDRGLLVLVQNQIEGRRWRLTFVDLAASLRTGEAVAVQTVDLAPDDELEGFHMISRNSGFLVSSSRTDNLVPVALRWQRE